MISRVTYAPFLSVCGGAVCAHAFTEEALSVAFLVEQTACCASFSVIQSDGYSADSVHIRVAAKELLNRPERKKFLFVLSDGMPSAYGSEGSGEQEVHNVVEDARRKSIVVIPTMFGSDSFRQSCAASFGKMYSKNLLSCALYENGKKLPGLFRRLIIMS